jgi:hypothetical protein
MSTVPAQPFDRAAFGNTLSFFANLNLLSDREAEQVLSLLEECFEFAPIIRNAESVHLHVEVDNINDIPEAKIQSLGEMAIDRHKEPDMVKYSYPSGINIVFSAFARRLGTECQAPEAVRRSPRHRSSR